jgi:hypothetical protein
MTVHIFLIIRPLGITSSRKREVVPVHAMKHIGGAAIKLHSFSTSIMLEGSGQFHVQTALYPDNNPSIHWVARSASLDVWEWTLSQNVRPVAQSLRHSDSHSNPLASSSSAPCSDAKKRGIW